MKKKKLLTAPFVVLLLILCVVVGLRVAKIGRLESAAVEPPVESAQPSPEVTEAPVETPQLPEETPEPVIEYTAGKTVFLDGNEITDTIVVDEVLYVPAQEAMDKLNRNFWRDEIETMTWDPLRVEGTEYMDILAFCESYKIATYDDDILYCTSAAGEWEVVPGVRCPVLLYHEISSNVWSDDPDMIISEAKFRQHIDTILERGYTPIWFEDLKYADEYEKPIIITVDDCWTSAYTALLPIVEEYQIKVTVFPVTGWLIYGNEHVVTMEQFEEIAACPYIDVQCHTEWHNHLNEVNRQTMIEELTYGKVELLQMTGEIPYVICYPGGRLNDTIREAAREEYTFGVMMTGPTYITGQGDPLVIYRPYIRSSWGIEHFISVLEG